MTRNAFPHRLEAAMRTLVVVVLATALLAACGEDSTEPEDDDPLVGTWVATSFTGMGFDLIALGMDLTITLDDDGTYTFDVENDLAEFCGAGNEGSDCVVEGTATYNATMVTINPGEENEIAFDYVINGSTLTLTGDIGGTPVTGTFTRQ